jgi:putative addiction module component (TIGR02574 family)
LTASFGAVHWPDAAPSAWYHTSAMRSADEILEDALALPAEARAAIAGSLISSLDDQIDPQVEELWAAEIARRIAEIDAGKVQLVPWTEVRRRLSEE